MFVIPSSQDLFLLEEKKVESEVELSNTAGSVKVKSEQLILILVELQMVGARKLPSAWPKIECGVGCHAR